MKRSAFTAARSEPAIGLIPTIAPIAQPRDVAPRPTGPELNQYYANTKKIREKLPKLSTVESIISLYSWEEMLRLADGVEIKNEGLDGEGTVNDRHLGVINNISRCERCFSLDCPGHYGIIDFGTLVYNPIYINIVVSILTCVCNSCGHLLITKEYMESKGLLKLPMEKRIIALRDECKKIDKCLREKPVLPGFPTIPCRPNPVFKISGIKDTGKVQFQNVQHGGRRSEKDFRDADMQIMSISQVYSILSTIPQSDIELMGFKYGSHPKNMIMHGMLVAPNVARPATTDTEGITKQDPLTLRYISILKKVKERNADASNLIYNELKTIAFGAAGTRVGMQEFKSILKMMQGKEGIIRDMLLGKRNNYCGRTVSGPGPTLRFGQIGIPRVWAPFLTKKVAATQYNIRSLQKLLDMNPPQIARYYSSSTNVPKAIHPGERFNLQIGTVVDRWLQDGDRIVINRQPTLHKNSMMGYEVVLTDDLTIKLHLSYTTPMNNDFDGDENNAWDPRDFEVETEVEHLMNVKRNIMSSEQNRPIMGLVMNSITGAYLMSNPAVRVNDDLLMELLKLTGTAISTLERRVAEFSVPLNSGQAIISAMLPEDFSYVGSQGVIIVKGVLIAGRLRKAHTGPSSSSIIQALYKKYGSEITANFFTVATWVFNKWLFERGFSVGLLDMMSLEKESCEKENVGIESCEWYDKNARILERELQQIREDVRTLGPKKEDKLEEALRQKSINRLVNAAIPMGQKLARDTISKNNSIYVMTKVGGGAKGDVANIGQMMGAVGQQFFMGQRLQPTITEWSRLLPSYDPGDESLEANAFVPESFMTGITPEGLFFIQAGGRQNILDTALNTARTGDLQRHMSKAFENIIVWHDGSIRNNAGAMFAPIYNMGYDVGEMVATKLKNGDESATFLEVDNIIAELNNERGWIERSAYEVMIRNRRGDPVINEDEIAEKIKLSEVDLPKIASSFGGTNLVVPEPMVVPVYLSKFEKARIIGARATQIDNGSPVLIPLLEDESDPVDIATKEYYAGILPIYVIRKYSDGTIERVYPTKENVMNS